MKTAAPITQAMIRRVIRSAKAEGLANPEVQVEILPGGGAKITVRAGVAGATKDGNHDSDIDRELADFRGNHGYS